jgi:hypothetical protein
VTDNYPSALTNPSSNVGTTAAKGQGTVTWNLGDGNNIDPGGYFAFQIFFDATTYGPFKNQVKVSGGNAPSAVSAPADFTIIGARLSPNRQAPQPIRDILGHPIDNP